MHDYYTGLDMDSFKVVADFAIDHAIWLHQSSVSHTARDGSKIIAKPIAEVVFEAVRGLPWDQLADNFNW